MMRGVLVPDISQVVETEMTKLVIDSQMESQLRGKRDSLELVNGAGRLIGFFTPFNQQHAADSPPGSSPTVVPFSASELKRREQETGGRSLAEIMSDLERRS